MIQEIADIFATFHDGGIESWEGNFSELKLKIDCIYLAQMINPDYEYFFVTLKGIELLEFHPWEQPIRKKLSDVLSPELEIAYSKIEDNIVKVSCHQYDKDLGDAGGELWIKAKSISVQNEDKISISPEDLYALRRKYWNKSRSKNSDLT